MNLTDIPISKTKMVVPKRKADLLTREHLLNEIQKFLDRKLITVSAPAGYGKTSILVDLVHHNELPFHWLALDLLDRDPERFIFPLFSRTTTHGIEPRVVNLNASNHVPVQVGVKQSTLGVFSPSQPPALDDVTDPL
jgi:hypothetical protein